MHDETTIQVMSGLRSSQKRLPTVLLYDQEGTRLFDEITKLDDYYVTAAEINVLKSKVTDIGRYIGSAVAVIELGCGSSTKAELLLKSVDAESYTAIDVSEAALQATARGIRKAYPSLKVRTLAADFTQLRALPQSRSSLSRLLFFPGSTIGNFEPDKAQVLLSHLRQMLSDGDSLLVGVDLKKDLDRLKQAYNDHDGVTARFNLNILNHVNKVARATFDPARFYHHAFYNERLGRIEMHLVSKCSQIVYVDGHMFKINKGETIHTENSYKYTVKEFIQLAEQSRFQVEKTWIEDEQQFSVHLLRVNRYGLH